MMVSVLAVRADETVTGVVPLNVKATVVFWVVHSVKALTLTMSFLWIGIAPNEKSIFLLVRGMNSMTFCRYKNPLRRVPEVDWVVAVL